MDNVQISSFIDYRFYFKYVGYNIKVFALSVAADL
jgi:hypothetical protein